MSDQGEFDAALIGCVEAFCPTCGGALVKFPTRRIACADCESEIFVRTRPLDGKKVIVNSLIDTDLARQRVLVQGAKIRCNVVRADAEHLAQGLTDKFGMPPSTADLIWAYLGQSARTNLLSGAFGLYRNNQLDRAAILDDESRSFEALGFIFRVLYLDANGVSNGTRIEPETLFSTELIFDSPLVYKTATRIMFMERVTPTSATALFLQVAKQEQDMTGAPREPAEIWSVVQEKLFRPIEVAIRANFNR